MPPTVLVNKVASMYGHKGAIYSLCAGDGTNNFYTAGGDGMLVKWNVNEPDNGMLIAKVPTNIFSACLLHQQNVMLLGQMQGGIHVIDLLTKQEVKHLTVHKAGVYTIASYDAGQTFIAAAGDGSISNWIVDGMHLEKQVILSNQSLRCMAKHPSLPVLAVGCSDHHIYLLDCQSLNVISSFKAHQHSVFSVFFSPDGKWLLSGGRDAQLMVWNVAENYQLYQQIPAHLFTINSIVYSPAGHLFATASRDKTIKIWDAESFDLLKVIDKEKYQAHNNSVNQLLWNDYLISCGDDRIALVWEISY